MTDSLPPLPLRALIKIPRQPRSVLMVHSILDAGMVVIREEGLAAMSTNRVADRAGISIGSLYQYFDSKEQLYAALLDRIVGELMAIVDRRSPALAEQPLRAWVRDLLGDVWDYLEADQGMYLRVLRNWSQLDFMRGIDALEQKLLGVLSLYALQHGAAGGPDLPARIYILINSVLFTLVRYISRPSPLVSREALMAAFGEMVERALG